MIGVNRRDPLAQDSLDLPVGDRHRVVASLAALVLGIEFRAEPAQGDLPGFGEHRRDRPFEVVEIDVGGLCGVDGANGTGPSSSMACSTE